MSGDWLFNQMSPAMPGFWLLLSLVSGAVVIYLEPVWPRIRWRTLWAAQRILIPYFGLILGGLSPRLMGLAHLDWSAGLGIGLVLIFAVTMLLLLVRATVDLPDPSEVSWREPLASRLEPELSGPAQDTDKNDGAAGLVGLVAQTAGWRMLANGIFICGVREFQWVFWRGALWEILLMLPVSPEAPGYWAVWLAAGLVLLELLARRLTFAHTIFQVVILICTSILFLYTRNFWLCWTLHTIAQLIAAPGPLAATRARLPWRTSAQ